MSETRNEAGIYHGNTSDFPTIDRALAGDQLAYEELFKKYERKILNLFTRLTKNNIADSEDFLQNTFALAFSKLDTFKKKSSFYTWLHRIAVNVFLMSCRCKKRYFIPIEEFRGRQVTDGGLIVSGMLEDNSALDRDRRGELGRLDQTLENVLNKILVGQLMHNLPPGYKKILELQDLQGFNCKEVATQLRCSLGNVKSQHHNAIEKLRARV